MRTSRVRRTLCFVVSVVLLAAACTDGADGGGDDAVATADERGGTSTEQSRDRTGDGAVEAIAPDTTTQDTTAADEPDASTGALPEPGPASFATSPGVEQITVTDAEPGRRLTASGADGVEVASGVVDDFGSLLFRTLPAGEELTVGDDDERSEPVAPLARDEHPAPAFYADQRLPTDGLGYITTRDGTALSASVWLPGPPEGGPYPTVVEYSGYTPSDPDSIGFPDLLNGLGFAYVGVNIRGTGCSGGSFRYFEYAQSLDGYDAIETVAAQPWVSNNRVGMVGVSYPGISQLFVGQTRPPSLAAITPFSVLADSFVSTLYPGGILNTGFAVPWVDRIEDAAQPNGQEWSVARIEAGDAECEANQRLRLQNPDLLAEIAATPFWDEVLAGELAPRLFVDRIEVPTFVAGAWQDEQTGGHFPTMLDRFTGTDRLYASLVNGLHTESMSPTIFDRWVEFLMLYVAGETPTLERARLVAPLLAPGIFGTADFALPAEDRFAGLSYDEALAAFEAEPPIEVHFEQGAAEGFGPRTPMARFTESFEAWPVPQAVATRLFLDGDGLLDATTGADGSTTEYLAVPDGVDPTWYEGTSDGIWSVDVVYDWGRPGNGTFGEWTTPPLTDDTVIVGSSSVDLWLRSNLGDTDLEVTLSEIRPDGRELYVQSGWLRASQRALDGAEATELRPAHTHRAGDAAPLPDTGFEPVRVEVHPVAHAFRAGSRIRLTVDSPGGNRPVWRFETISNGEQVTIAHDESFPSALVLPVVPGIEVPAEYPDCDSLRGQPCRAVAP